LPTANVKYGIEADSVAESIGLRDGDMITAVGGKPVERFDAIVREIIFNGSETIDVLRDGQPVSLTIPTGTISKISKAQRNTIIMPRTPFKVNEVTKKSAAEKMGLKKGDSII